VIVRPFLFDLRWLAVGQQHTAKPPETQIGEADAKLQPVGQQQRVREDAHPPLLLQVKFVVKNVGGKGALSGFQGFVENQGLEPRQAVGEFHGGGGVFRAVREAEREEEFLSNRTLRGFDRHTLSVVQTGLAQQLPHTQRQVGANLLEPGVVRGDGLLPLVGSLFRHIVVKRSAPGEQFGGKVLHVIRAGKYTRKVSLLPEFMVYLRFLSLFPLSQGLSAQPAYSAK